MSLPSQVTVLSPPEISDRPGPVVYQVVDLGGGRVRLSPYDDRRYGPTMPQASIKHFVNDLSGRVELPLRGHREIDAVLRGRAKLLGKGDDGLAFQVGNKVVKVSTTVPFQPHNDGHLSPEQAVERLRRQTEVHNKLATIVPNLLDRAEFVKHGDKGFQIKPFVDLLARFTRQQLDQVQDGLIAIHRAGYTFNDNDIQVGLRNGKPILFDVGKAEPIPPNDAAHGIYSRVEADMENLGHLYKKFGFTYVRRDVDKARKYWDAAVKLAEKTTIEPGLKGLAKREIIRGADLRREQALATLRGHRLEKRLDEIDEDEKRWLDVLE